MSITLTVLFKTFNQSLVHSAQLFEQNRLIWVAESLLEKIKFSSFSDISHCLIWQPSHRAVDQKKNRDYCYYVIDKDHGYYIDTKPASISRPEATNNFFSFLVEVTPMSFSSAFSLSSIEKKNPFDALKIQLKIEHQHKKISLTGFKWVKNNESI